MPEEAGPERRRLLRPGPPRPGRRASPAAGPNLVSATHRPALPCEAPAPGSRANAIFAPIRRPIGRPFRRGRDCTHWGSRRKGSPRARGGAWCGRSDASWRTRSRACGTQRSGSLRFRPGGACGRRPSRRALRGRECRPCWRHLRRTGTVRSGCGSGGSRGARPSRTGSSARVCMCSFLRDRARPDGSPDSPGS